MFNLYLFIRTRYEFVHIDLLVLRELLGNDLDVCTIHSGRINNVFIRGPIFKEKVDEFEGMLAIVFIKKRYLYCG